MSNNSGDKSSDVQVGQPSSASTANAGSSNGGESQAKLSAPINLENSTTLNRPSELFDERSESPKEAKTEVKTIHDGPRELAAAENTPSALAQTAGEIEGEGGRHVNVPLPAASATARPLAVAHNPWDLAGEGLAPSQPPRPAEVATQAGGAVPPGLPPRPVVASSPEEPKPTPRPTPSGNAPPPLLDVEEFIREAEDRKRGAKTMREIKALADSIRQLRQRGVPFGSIHRGLKERGLLTCSRSRFDEICANLFPDLLDPKRRGSA